jgi:hypothetical protein
VTTPLLENTTRSSIPMAGLAAAMAARTLAVSARLAARLALRTCLAVGAVPIDESLVAVCANTFAELNVANIAPNTIAVFIDFTSFSLIASL